ncbi:hypothetical protein CDG81_12775 [Actinopolyspora erythraea]|uniref:Uncharacterized protein n=1 Tax=Actinopolyspora erythraea TaxID=414996 RepID=A0A099D5Q2_9ACTN|nr:hypothetical protein [Actinopolyspora erythraea]ASU79016.1 hypothetical protein CDG81_12775 [Actinopolyspora erythraea]KGI81142.1 hypothetical protein IL38_12870 [Actinopolyspora erythraea]
METTERQHYWLPVPELTGVRWHRHAFRGKNWDGRPADTSVCGRPCAMARPSELDWFQAPTCRDCTEALLAEQSGARSSEGER